MYFSVIIKVNFNVINLYRPVENPARGMTVGLAHSPYPLLLLTLSRREERKNRWGYGAGLLADDLAWTQDSSRIGILIFLMAGAAASW
jgi:hypothetical protein